MECPESPAGAGRQHQRQWLHDLHDRIWQPAQFAGSRHGALPPDHDGYYACRAPIVVYFSQRSPPSRDGDSRHLWSPWSAGQRLCRRVEPRHARHSDQRALLSVRSKLRFRGPGRRRTWPTPTQVSPWSATNYLANWNILCAPDPTTAGYTAWPQTFNNVTDGLSNTIMLAEAYAWCEGRGRTAFLAWHTGQGGFSPPASSNGVGVNGVHNFGLTFPVEPRPGKIEILRAAALRSQRSSERAAESDVHSRFEPLLSGSPQSDRGRRL